MFLSPLRRQDGRPYRGQIYTLARLHADTELAGACFSPDGSILFVNAYRPGRTLAIRGPWGSFAARAQT